MNMMPILSVRVPAGISHNIAPLLSLLPADGSIRDMLEQRIKEAEGAS